MNKTRKLYADFVIKLMAHPFIIKKQHYFSIRKLEYHFVTVKNYYHKGMGKTLSSITGNNVSYSLQFQALPLGFELT